MTKTRAEEEEEAACESTRGKESKFVAERSETSGMDGNKGSASGSSSSNANSSSNSQSNNDSDRKSDANRNRSGRGGRYRVPSNFCRDFIFHSCKRRGCKFIHPEVDSPEYKEARASRPELSQQRERSRSPLPEVDSSGKPTICRDFLRNVCYRGKDCRYKHPSDGEKEDLPWPQLCIDYRSGNCKRYDCRSVIYAGYLFMQVKYICWPGTVAHHLIDTLANES